MRIRTLKFKDATWTHREAAMIVCISLNQSGGQVLCGVTLRCVAKVARVREEDEDKA